MKSLLPFIIITIILLLMPFLTSFRKKFKYHFMIPLIISIFFTYTSIAENNLLPGLFLALLGFAITTKDLMTAGFMKKYKIIKWLP